MSISELNNKLVLIDFGLLGVGRVEEKILIW